MHNNPIAANNEKVQGCEQVFQCEVITNIKEKRFCDDIKRQAIRYLTKISRGDFFSSLSNPFCYMQRCDILKTWKLMQNMHKTEPILFLLWSAFLSSTFMHEQIEFKFTENRG